mgnify:CR=1 FL=1
MPDRTGGGRSRTEQEPAAHSCAFPRTAGCHGSGRQQPRRRCMRRRQARPRHGNTTTTSARYANPPRRLSPISKLFLTLNRAAVAGISCISPRAFFVRVRLRVEVRLDRDDGKRQPRDDRYNPAPAQSPAPQSSACPAANRRRDRIGSSCGAALTTGSSGSMQSGKTAPLVADELERPARPRRGRASAGERQERGAPRHRRAQRPARWRTSTRACTEPLRRPRRAASQYRAAALSWSVGTPSPCS